VMMPVVPMYHANAWGLAHASALVGAKQVLPGPHLDAASVLDLLDRERVTLSAAVPTVWLAVAEMLGQQVGRWRLQPGLRVVCGGSAIPESLIRGLDRHGIQIRQAWGMTEMSPLGTVCSLHAHHVDLPEDAQIAIRAKQGPAIPFVDLRAMVGSRE